MSDKKPNFNLWAVTDGPSDDKPQLSGTVGAGWLNDDGSISITLNAGVLLDSRTTQRLKLYKWDEKNRRDAQRQREQESAATPSKETKKPASRFDDMEDDIPF